MRFFKVLLWMILGYFTLALLIGVSFSVFMASAGYDKPQLESAVGGLAGLAGAIIGFSIGMRRNRPVEVE